MRRGHHLYPAGIPATDRAGIREISKESYSGHTSSYRISLHGFNRLDIGCDGPAPHLVGLVPPPPVRLSGRRKLHTAHIPRLGGIAFFPCITITVSLVIIGHNQWMGSNMLDVDLTNRLLSVFCGLFLLYLTGMMDDLIGVRYRSKFLIQILCGILLVASGLCFDNLYGLFGIEAMPYYIGAPFTVFIIVYILNAINLIDGIDGLASGLSIIAFFAFGCMFIRLQWWMYAFICLATIGVLLPFFYYNVYGNVHRGRKIFMGDTGSLTIGMLLAVMALREHVRPREGKTFPGAVVIAFSFDSSDAGCGTCGAAPLARAQAPFPAGQESYPSQVHRSGAVPTTGDGLHHWHRSLLCRGERFPDPLLVHYDPFPAGRGGMDGVALLHHGEDQPKE